MGLTVKDVKQHGAKATYVNIEGVGNVRLDTVNKQIKLTIKPNLFVSKTYRDSEGSTPLNYSQGTCNEDVVIEGEYYDNIMGVLYEALKSTERFKEATDN